MDPCIIDDSAVAEALALATAGHHMGI